jgi:hypothetical protein
VFLEIASEDQKTVADTVKPGTREVMKLQRGIPRLGLLTAAAQGSTLRYVKLSARHVPAKDVQRQQAASAVS